MRWQKAARLLVAAVGVGTAAAIFVFTRERPAPGPPPVPAAADPTAVMQSGAGVDLRYKDDVLQGELKYSGRFSYKGDRVVHTGVVYRLPNGTVLEAGRVEARGTSSDGSTPDELTFTERFRLTTADDMTLGGDAGTFNETTGVADIPGAVTFSRGQMAGTGTGGVYERDTGVFRILRDAEVTMAPADDKGAPVEATAESMTFTPEGKSVLFEGGAVLEREQETMAGERATLFLSDDESRFRLIELRGSASVMPAAGGASDLPEMKAGDIDLAFYDGSDALERARLAGEATMVQRTDGGRRSIEASDISFTTAPDGRTLTRLDARPRGRNGRVVVRTPASAAGAPSRTITASTLVATGNDRAGLTAALFEGGVEFEEAGAARGARAGLQRVGRSRRLTLAIKGQLDAIEQARFERDVTFTSGTTRGFADVGIYRAGAGELDLQPAADTPGRKASVVDGDAGVTVEAVGFITAFLDTGNLLARGDVTTATSGSTSARPAASTSIFNAAERIYGSGAEFRYDDATMGGTYRGSADAPARLNQGRNVVSALEIEYLRDAQDLRAKGQVDSTFEMSPTARAGRGTTAPADGAYQVTAETLTYDESERTARYAGSAVLESADGRTTADAMDLILAEEARTLDRLEATGRVRAELQGGRQARGDRLVYESREDLYQLWGKPLTWIARENDGTCYAQDASFVRFDGGLGAPDFPAGQNADGGAPRRTIACPAVPAK